MIYLIFWASCRGKKIRKRREGKVQGQGLDMFAPERLMRNNIFWGFLLLWEVRN